jgi:hypothetical protein
MPSVPSIVPEMLRQELDDTPEGAQIRSQSLRNTKAHCHNYIELEAARVRSEQIDADLASEAAFKTRRRREEVHVLLLGKVSSAPLFLLENALTRH